MLETYARVQAALPVGGEHERVVVRVARVVAMTVLHQVQLVASLPARLKTQDTRAEIRHKTLSPTQNN